MPFVRLFNVSSLPEEMRKYIFPSAGEMFPMLARIVNLREELPSPLVVMRNSFTQPQFLSERRAYALCSHLHAYHLSLKPSFVERLASTSAAKQPFSKPPLNKQSFPASNFKKPTSWRADLEQLEQEHTPKALSRPLGQLQPPQPDENTGVDPRSWRERRDDFWNYDKHLARRQQLYVFRFIIIHLLAGSLFGSPGRLPK